MDVIDLIEEGEMDYENGDSSSAKSKFLKASGMLIVANFDNENRQEAF